MTTRLIRGVVAAVAGMVALTGCQFHGAYDLPLPGKVVGSGDGYHVKAIFSDVVDVVPYTHVMANDVPIGQVDSVTRLGWNAEVDMTIRKDVVLPANAIADVRQTSLLGEKFIELDPPTGTASVGRLADGATIPLAQTSRNPEVEEVLGALSSILSGGGVQQLKTISTELNKAMDGRQGDVRSVLSSLDVLVTSLNGQRANIIEALSEVNKLTRTLNKEHGVVASALDSFGPALKVLNQQHQDLMTMLTALDRLGRVGTNVISQSRANIVADLKELGPTLKGLADAGKSLPQGLVMLATFPFPKEAATLAKGDYSNALFHMDFDLNKALSGSLHGGDTGLPNVGQLCSVYSNGSCAPLMAALCTVTGLTLFCSPTAAKLGSSVTGGKKPTTAPVNPLDGLLGPVTSGLLSPKGPLGGLLGPGTGLGGLL
ncbi:MCE family protein [Nocardioides baekrokdamisoli]|uniref:MCE family protein n=1 Tax=Nocardioides baekrokdamisoli TaxID=1804624 RepID=UPI000F7718F1|nr:MCE family protein [Nocardioides baekrokdamisoli]